MFKRLKLHSNQWMILVLVVMWALLLLYVNMPWLGHHDANGVWLGSAARNLLIYGPSQIGLVPLLNRAPIPPDLPNYYVHHPPLIVWTTAGFDLLFGMAEMSARLVSVFSTLISIAAFYVMCRRLYDAGSGLVCAILYAFTPMMIYFGRMPDHEPMSLAFLMLFGAVYVNWVRVPTPRRWWWLAVLVIAAIWTSWACVFVIGAFCFFGLWTVRPKQRLALIGLGVVMLLAIIALLAFYRVQYAATFDDLISAFNWRTSTVSEVSDSFTFVEFAVETTVHVVAGGTMALLILTLIGIIPALRVKNRLQQTTILALAASGFAYILVFRSASYVHDYYKIYLIPFMAITAACAVVTAYRNRRIRRFAQPALTSLFIVSSISAAVIINSWYAKTRDDIVVDIANYIAANTDKTDTVMTNLFDNPPLEYYAFRKMVWDVKLEDANRKAVGNKPAVYFYCPWLDAPENEHPPTTAEAIAACQITKMP
ncbi:MAG: glycosyltransferase family 39 protein [Anaerolineae bacterium]|nr:glycosyltransferase family 39 protein [Anaerolineae bacterium]